MSKLILGQKLDRLEEITIRFNNSCLIFEQWEQWLATAQWAVGSGQWGVGNGWRVVGSGWRAVESRHWAKGSGECMVNRFN